MPHRRLTEEEVLQRVLEDDKLYAALEDSVRAILTHGEDIVDLNDTLKSVIVGRIHAWYDEEVEEEGL